MLLRGSWLPSRKVASLHLNFVLSSCLVFPHIIVLFYLIPAGPSTPSGSTVWMGVLQNGQTVQMIGEIFQEQVDFPDIALRRSPHCGHVPCISDAHGTVGCVAFAAHEHIGCADS